MFSNINVQATRHQKGWNSSTGLDHYPAVTCHSSYWQAWSRLGSVCQDIEIIHLRCCTQPRREKRSPFSQTRGGKRTGKKKTRARGGGGVLVVVSCYDQEGKDGQTTLAPNKHPSILCAFFHLIFRGQKGLRTENTIPLLSGGMGTYGVAFIRKSLRLSGYGGNRCRAAR